MLGALSERANRDLHDDAWRPRVFGATRAEDAGQLDELLRSGAARFVHDTLDEQLRELLASRDPVRTWPREELDRRMVAHLDGRDLRTYGSWVFYPWSARLVHVLPRDEFREVRTDRNRYKITRDEQLRLASFRIGVIGLSVGNMAAVTFALEGVGGAFKIADFDRLSLSNLNRLRGGVHEMGVEKTVLAAREMFELDPYLEIERYRDGVQPETIDEFLAGGTGKLDLLVEECDDLYVKVVVRERARAHRIPVIMDTSDRGLLDIERFDREPERPIFHGLMGAVHAEELRGLETKDKVPFFLAIVDERRMSTRMAASLPEIKQTISSWPQLASSVALGGAVTADAARRILLGEHTESGRYYLDPSAIVADGQAMLREAVPPPPPFEVAEEARLPPVLPREPSRTGEITPEVVRWIAAMGALAPSAHNAQPWQLVWRALSRTLECRHDPSRDLPSLDFESTATWVAFGALVENVVLAAQQAGLRAEVRTWPDAADPHLAAAVHLEPPPQGDGETDALFPAIVQRVTNRRRDGRRPLPVDATLALARACQGEEARLHLLESGAALDEIGVLMGACDRVSLLNAAIHHDATHGYHWTPAEVRAHPHGIDVATMELSASERAGLRIMQQWRAMECLRAIGGGRALGELAEKLVASASAVGLITRPGTSRESYLRGGRAVQRLWLTATTHGVALQPITGLPYLFARLERGGGEGFSETERAELQALRGRYLRLFDVSAGHAEVLLFRLHVAGPPTARSLRRPLDDVLRLA